MLSSSPQRELHREKLTEAAMDELFQSFLAEVEAETKEPERLGRFGSLETALGGPICLIRGRSGPETRRKRRMKGHPVGVDATFPAA